jgi:hypothetical protein
MIRGDRTQTAAPSLSALLTLRAKPSDESYTIGRQNKATLGFNFEVHRKERDIIVFALACHHLEMYRGVYLVSRPEWVGVQIHGAI